MGSFTNNAITENGRLLLADAQTGGEFVATKIVMGSSYIPAGKTARTMTDVVSPVKNLVINKIERSNDGKVIIGGAFSNEDISTEFYFRELALYARCVWRDAGGNITRTGEEKLYSYGNAGAAADLIPAYSTSTLVEKQIDLVSYVGNDAMVNLTIESGLYQVPIKDAPTKDVPVDTDSFAIIDSEAGGATKRLLWGKIKAALKTYFDALYASASHSHVWSSITGKPSAYSPSAHKSSHAAGGTDALSASDIGAAMPYSGTATLAVANWTGSSAPYTYTVTVAGMLDSDNPQIGVALSHTDIAADDLLQKEWAKAVGNGAKATAGKITLYAKEKPTVAIPMFWRGSR